MTKKEFMGARDAFRGGGLVVLLLLGMAILGTPLLVDSWFFKCLIILGSMIIAVILLVLIPKAVGLACPHCGRAIVGSHIGAALSGGNCPHCGDPLFDDES